MSAYLVFFSSSTSYLVVASSSSLPHDTDGADRKGRVVTIHAIPSKTSSKKAECHYPSRLLVKTTKELNCHCSSRVLEQKLERKNYHYSSRALVKKRKKLKKSRKYHYSSLQDDRARKLPWLSAWPLHLALISSKKSGEGREAKKGHPSNSYTKATTTDTAMPSRPMLVKFSPACVRTIRRLL